MNNYNSLFYFSWQRTNEESLKHLSAYLESVQSRQISTIAPKHINFYVRNSGARGSERIVLSYIWAYVPKLNKRFVSPDSFKLIRIPLEREPDVKRFLKHILQSCNLPTERVEKIKIKKHSTNSKLHSDRNVYSRPDGSKYDDHEVYERKVNRAKLDKTLK